MNHNIDRGAPQNHETNSDDPYYDLDCDFSKAWQPQDALIETATLLDLLHDPESIAATPAIFLFIRANRLCRSLLSLGLRHEALQLCTIAHDIIQNLSESHPEAYEGYYAESLLSLSHCYGGMGLWDGALIVIQESAEKFRGLAKANPAAYDKRLALSLSRLSTCLSILGRTKETLVTVREAVEIIRVVKDRGLYDPGLAATLCCLSNQLLGANQTIEALNAAKEAVAMHQSLTVRNPDQSLAVGNFEALQLRLTRSLVCLSSCLCSVGETKRAIAVSEESVERCRFLAKANPDSDVFNVNLARCLKALAHCLSAAGIMEDARNATHEAVQLYRSMTKTSPDAYQSYLAGSLFDLCLCLINMGLIEDALDVIKESVKIRRALAKANPDTSKADLAISLFVLSELLADEAKEKEPPRSTRRSMDSLIHMAKVDPSLFNIKLSPLSHRVRRAIESTENIAKLRSRIDPEFLDDSSSHHDTTEDVCDAISEAVDLCRDLFETSPDVFRPVLAASLFSLSFRLSEAGRVEDALDAYTEAAGHYRALVETNPGVYEPDLARCLYSLADCFVQMGKTEAALPVVEESTSGWRALAKTDSETFDPDLANSLEMLSLCLSGTGKDVDAFNVLEEAVAIYRPLAEANSPAYGPCLSRCLHKRYLHLVAMGKTREALDVIQELVVIRRELARANPKEFKSDLATSLDALASCLRDTNEIEDSEELDAFEEPVRHHRSLSKADTLPSDVERAMSLIDSSDHLISIGKNGRALDAIKEAGPLCRKLAKTNRRFDDILSRLANSLDDLFSRFLDTEDNVGALDAMEEAVQIRRVLAEEGLDSDRAKLASSLDKLSRCLRDAGEDEEALDAMKEAVGIQRKLVTKRQDAFFLARFLDVLYQRLHALGKTGEALEAITGKESVKIRRRLAKGDTSDPGLASSLCDLSFCLHNLRRDTAALDAILEAVEIYRSVFRMNKRFRSELVHSLEDLEDRYIDLRWWKDADKAREEANRIR